MHVGKPLAFCRTQTRKEVIEMLDRQDEELDGVLKRRVYSPPEVIVYGSVAALAMGSTRNTDDDNMSNPHYHD
jgi:hypothetical protein